MDKVRVIELQPEEKGMRENYLKKGLKDAKGYFAKGMKERGEYFQKGLKDDFEAPKSEVID